jgi:aspartyl protease family protein
MGNEIVVQAQVNGRNCPMIFDTGATVCAFSGAQVATLGIAIPEDARIGTVQGVAGLSRASIFPVSSIKLGPIEKRDFDIEVLQNAQLPLPLLGQTFYGDWQFTIDYEGKCIHFLRR